MKSFRVTQNVCAAVLILVMIYNCHAFAPKTFLLSTGSRSEFSVSLAAKGFSSEQPKKRVKSAGQVDREGKAAKYDEISKGGGQEYRILVRKFGSDDKSWLPAGAIAVPRGAQVSDAIFSNEAGIKQSIVKMYPKLKGQEEEFEFGYNLKIYPDDPVEVAVKSSSKVSSGPASSVVNWVTNLLSPVDTSDMKQ